MAPQPRDEAHDAPPGLTYFNRDNTSGNQGSLAILDRPREEHPSLDTEVNSGQSDTEVNSEQEHPSLTHSIDSMVDQVQEDMTTAATPKPPSKAKARRAKGKNASKATKKTSLTVHPSIIKRPAGNFNTTFPGVPKTQRAPRDIGKGMKLYTDVGSGAWRVKCDGRANRTFTWKTDPKGAWERLCN